jgi:hypothetical protein
MNLFELAGYGKARHPSSEAQELPSPSVHSLCVQKGKPKGMEGEAVEEGYEQPNRPASRG